MTQIHCSPGHSGPQFPHNQLGPERPLWASLQLHSHKGSETPVAGEASGTVLAFSLRGVPSLLEPPAVASTLCSQPLAQEPGQRLMPVLGNLENEGQRCTILDIRNSMKQYIVMHELEMALVTHGNGRTLIKPVCSRYPLFCLSSSRPILPHFLTSVGIEMDEG